MERRPEHFVIILLAGGASAWVIFDAGPLFIPILALIFVALLMIPGQRAHNAARAAAIAEYQRTRNELSDVEQQDRLNEIQRLYGKNHPAVRRLVGAEHLHHTAANSD